MTWMSRSDAGGGVGAFEVVFWAPAGGVAGAFVVGVGGATVVAVAAGLVTTPDGAGRVDVPV